MARRILYNDAETPDATYGAKWIAEYDSVLDLAALVDSECDKSRNTRTSLVQGKGYSWDLGLSYEGAREYLVSGWREGAEKIHAEYLPVYEQITSKMIRQNLSYDVTGDFIDVERVACGEPDCWGVWQQEVVENPGNRVITLDYDVGASSGVNAETLLARGSAVVALVEALEYAGYRVEVRAVDCQKAFNNWYTIDTVYVKRADEPLNLPRLAFTLAHTAFMRRILFAAWERGPEHVYEGMVRYSYGFPTNPKAIETRADLYFKGAYLGDISAGNPESARKWVRDQLLKQGIQFHE